jgi:hypothetical protein
VFSLIYEGCAEGNTKDTKDTKETKETKDTKETDSRRKAQLFYNPRKLPLPFKGRAGVGMGIAGSAPIPLLSSPLKGEGRV